MNGPSFVLQTKILPSHGNRVKTEIGTLATAGIALLATHLFAISTKNTDFVAVVILFILNWVLVLFLHAPSLSLSLWRSLVTRRVRKPVRTSGEIVYTLQVYTLLYSYICKKYI